MTLCNRLWVRVIGSPIALFVTSIVMVVGLLYAALASSTYSFRSSNRTIRIYCASAAVEPFNQIVDQFNHSEIADLNSVQGEIIRVGGSGELAGQISAENSAAVKSACDIFVSADQFRIETMINDGLLANPLTLACQHPVLAAPGNLPIAKSFSNLNSVLDSEAVRLAIGSESTAIGAITRQYAKSQNLLNRLEARKVTEAENVMTLALAVVNNSVDVAVVWDSTITQLNTREADSIVSLGFLDPDQKLSSTIQLARINGANSAAVIFDQFVRDHSTSAHQTFSRYGFSTPILSDPIE